MRKLNLFLILGAITFAHAAALAEKDSKEASVDEKKIDTAASEASSIGDNEIVSQLNEMKDASAKSKRTGDNFEQSKSDLLKTTNECKLQGNCPVKVDIAQQTTADAAKVDQSAKDALIEKVKATEAALEKKVNNTVEEIAKTQAEIDASQASGVMDPRRAANEQKLAKLQKNLETYHKIYEAVHAEVYNKDGAKTVAEKQIEERKVIANGNNGPGLSSPAPGGGNNGSFTGGNYGVAGAGTGASGMAASPQQLAAAGGAAGTLAAANNNATKTASPSNPMQAKNSSPSANGPLYVDFASKSASFGGNGQNSSAATSTANAARTVASSDNPYKSTASGEVRLDTWSSEYKTANFSGKIKDSPYSSSSASVGKVGSGAGAKGGDAKDAKKEESLKTFAGDEKLGSGSSDLALAGSETDAAIQSIMNDLNLPSIEAMSEEDIKRLTEEIPGFDTLLSSYGGKLPPGLSGANFTAANIRRAVEAHQASLGGVSGDESLSLFLRVKTYHNQCQKKGCVSRSRPGAGPF